MAASTSGRHAGQRSRQPRYTTIRDATAVVPVPVVQPSGPVRAALPKVRHPEQHSKFGHARVGRQRLNLIGRGESRRLVQRGRGLVAAGHPQPNNPGATVASPTDDGVKELSAEAAVAGWRRNPYGDDLSLSRRPPWPVTTFYTDEVVVVRGSEEQNTVVPGGPQPGAFLPLLVSEFRFPRPRRGERSR